MSLYDALFLYGLAVRDAYDETRNQSVFLDGSLIWQKMTGRQFIGERQYCLVARTCLPTRYSGATGQVLINNRAVRVPSYATYYVHNGVDGLALLAERK